MSILILLILYSYLDTIFCFLLSKTALNCQIDLLDDHLDQEEHIYSNVNTDEVQKVPSVVVPQLRVWYVLSELEHEPDAYQNDRFVNDLDRIVQFVIHRAHSYEENQQKGTHYVG